MTDSDDVLGGLPGEAVVRAGLADLKSGRRSIPSWLVEIARTRLSRAGVMSAPAAPHSPETTAELELYRLLRIEGGDAYSRYNALIRELVSFESALDQRLKKRPAAK